MAFNKYITFIICLAFFSNCSPKVRNNLATHKKLDQSQIDKIKKLTYQALNNQDCVQLREYLTSLFFNLNCATKFESEYIKVRDSVENYFKKEKLLKKRNVNNCIFFENYFDAVYWAVITATTVGYGDIVPVTIEGKFATAVLVVTGIVL